MDTETDEYMDYTGCSPGAVSSESSTMDRSCSSTPVGNESTAAGERWPGTGDGGRGAAAQGRGDLGAPGLGQTPPPKAGAAEPVLGQQVHGQAASKEDRPVCSGLGRAHCSHLLPSCPLPSICPRARLPGEAQAGSRGIKQLSPGQ